MLIQHNNLRVHRKHAQLKQTDIASVMALSDFATISRWEQGAAIPSLEYLLVYHLLFDISIEDLFDRCKSQLIDEVAPRIESLLDTLRSLKPKPHVLRRMTFLREALRRLRS
jgi:transcriptional regulator with XRE-family HTH domain